MNNQQPKSFRFTDKKAEQESLFSSKNEMQNEHKQRVNSEIEFTFILKKIFLSLKKLFVAIKYQFFKVTGGVLSGMKLPWLKIAVVALLAYLMFNKDFQFTINMSAPTAFLPADEEENNRSKVSQMGIAQAVAHHEKVRNPFVDVAGDNAKTKKDKAYIRRFKKTAQQEMKQFGIPASIKMAQGLLESGAGQSGLSKRNNNHFGIKCFSKKCGKGHCSNHSDDHHKDFFVKYKSSWESWRAHSKLLNTKHYKSLKEYEPDYEAWAYGLKKLGYATDPRYPEKLLAKINKYHLYLLDK